MLNHILNRVVPPSSGQRFPALDGLRGLAALAVAVGHLPIIGHGKAWFSTYGRVGVTVFFVLSAFLLYYPWLVKGIGRVADYYRRRAHRIYPAYTVGLAFGVAAALVAHQSITARGLISEATFTIAWLTPRPFPMVNPSWSLCPEVQFYLILPVLAWIIASRPAPWLISAIGATSVIPFLIPSRTLNLYAHPLTANLPFWAPPFLLGMLAAVMVARRRVPRWAAPVGLTFLIGLRLFSDLRHWSLPAYYQTALLGHRNIWASWGAFLAVAGLAAHPQAALSRIFGWAPLRCLGITSFGLFLFHFPVYTILTAAVGEKVCLLIGLPVAMALGALSYLYVEQPMMRRASSYSKIAGMTK